MSTLRPETLEEWGEWEYPEEAVPQVTRPTVTPTVSAAEAPEVTITREEPTTVSEKIEEYAGYFGQAAQSWAQQAAAVFGYGAPGVATGVAPGVPTGEGAGYGVPGPSGEGKPSIYTRPHPDAPDVTEPARGEEPPPPEAPPSWLSRHWPWLLFGALGLGAVGVTGALLLRKEEETEEPTGELPWAMGIRERGR